MLILPGWAAFGHGIPRLNGGEAGMNQGCYRQAKQASLAEKQSPILSKRACNQMGNKTLNMPAMEDDLGECDT
jgi:hypothetical protein